MWNGVGDDTLCPLNPEQNALGQAWQIYEEGLEKFDGEKESGHNRTGGKPGTWGE